MAATGLYDEDGSYRVTVVGNDGTGTSADQVQGTAAANAAAVGSPVQTGGIYELTASTYDNNDAVPLHTGARGGLLVQLLASDNLTPVATSAGSSDGVATSSTSLTVRPYNYIFNGTTWDRMVKPNTTSRIASSAASVNATSAKATAGNVFKVFGNNAKASVIYLKIYNKATAPTVGTDTPVLTIPIAASGRFEIDIGGANGFYLGTGIAYGFTTDAADAGTTALLAGDILGFTLTYA